MAEPPKRQKVLPPTTRSAGHHFLIGRAACGITGSKLPTLRQVLQYVLYVKDMSPSARRTASCIKQAVDEVLPFWMMAGIKTILKISAEKRLEGIWNNWMSLKKSMKKDDPKGHRRLFEQELDRLWDIGAEDAVSVIQQNRFLTAEKQAEDIQFYRDQQSQRLGTMSGRDKVYSSLVKDKSARLQRAESFRARHPQEYTLEDEEEFTSSSSSPHQSDSADSSTGASVATLPETSTSNEYVTLKAPRNLMERTEVLETLDRLKISDNVTAMLFAVFIKACGGDLAQFKFSRSTIHMNRVANLYEVSHEILSDLIEDPPQNVALHWDGKLIEDRFGSKFEALTIVVTAAPQFTAGKILGVQKLERATGVAQAESTFQMLKAWGLDVKVRALVFDTTASNRGWKSGAAKILEELLGRKLFFNACRHHVYELVVGAVWKCIFGKTTTGPENTLFNQFKSRWLSIDKTERFKVLEVPTVLEERKLPSY